MCDIWFKSKPIAGWAFGFAFGYPLDNISSAMSSGSREGSAEVHVRRAEKNVRKKAEAIERQRQQQERLFKNEPDGKWHPMCTVHTGGPLWRWPSAGCLTRRKKSRLQNQYYDLTKTDLVEHWCRSVMDLPGIKIQHKWCNK